MATLLIEHPITDFAVWCAAFNRFAERRRAGGVRAERIYQPVADARYVVIALDFPDAEHAERFHRFLVEEVWPKAAPALAGEPRVTVLEPRVPAVG